MRKSVILMFVLLIAGCSKQITYNSPEAILKITRSVVRITAEYVTDDRLTLAPIYAGSSGTGFSIAAGDKDRTSFILTNKHICSMEKAASYTLTTYTGIEVPAQFVAIDRDADVCLLRAKNTIAPLVLSDSDAILGERIIVVGAPDGIYPIVVDGIVSKYSYEHMTSEPYDNGPFEVSFRAQMISAPTYFGNSGSPVVGVDGHVKGIVFAVHTEEGSEKEHIAFMVPVEVVHRFLREQAQELRVR